MQCTLFLLWSMCRHSHLVPRVERTCGRTSECADVQANALVRMVRISTSVVSTMHAQMCTLDRCCEHQRTHCLHARYKMCICAHVWLRNKDGGVSLVYESTCCLVWEFIATQGKIRVSSVYSLFLTRVGVYVGVCVCMRTHTHTLRRWVTRM